MEKTKNAIQEIKSLLIKFGFLKEEEPKTEEVYDTFLALKLKDGTALMVKGDKLVEGAEVTVVTQDAEVPTPDGEYELEDGTKITVKDSKVETITPAEPASEEAPAEPAPAPAEEPVMPEMMELVELMKKCINALNEVSTNMEAKFNDVDTKIKDLTTNVEEFAKQPAGKPIKFNKTEVEPEKLSTLDARVKAIVDLNNKNKNK